MLSVKSNRLAAGSLRPGAETGEVIYKSCGATVLQLFLLGHLYSYCKLLFIVVGLEFLDSVSFTETSHCIFSLILDFKFSPSVYTLCFIGKFCSFLFVVI